MHTQQTSPLSQDFAELLAQLFRRYPSGLRRSHQELLDSLLESGLNHEDAELAARFNLEVIADEPVHSGKDHPSTPSPQGDAPLTKAITTG